VLEIKALISKFARRKLRHELDLSDLDTLTKLLQRSCESVHLQQRSVTVICDRCQLLVPWSVSLEIWELVLALKLKLVWNPANFFISDGCAIKIVGIDLANTHEERFSRAIKVLSLKCLDPELVLNRIESFNSSLQRLLEEVP